MSVAWVSAGIAVTGVGASIYGANKSADSASDATDASADASAAALAFEQEKYDDWQSVYGPLQDNLSEYYNSLSADSYMAAGLQNSEQEFETSMQRINESLAQRGITNSAVSASIEAQAEIGQAENRATIRSEAESAVNQDKQSFLQIGLGLNPSNSVSSALQSNANNLANAAANATAASGQATANAINTTLSTASDLANDWKEASYPEAD